MSAIAFLLLLSCMPRCSLYNPRPARGDTVGHANTIHVSSTEGSDSTGDGSVNRPFATIQRAQIAARHFVALDEQDASVDVMIASGHYYVPEGLSFDEHDSSARGNTSYLGNGLSPDDVVIHGGILIPSSAWSRESPGAPVWVANVTELVPSPAPHKTSKQCGATLPGMTFQGGDLRSFLAGSLDACCQACANDPSCGRFSFCGPDHPTCGEPGHPVDCYLKTIGGGRYQAMPHWTSGCFAQGKPSPCTRPPGPSPSPPPPPGSVRPFSGLVDNGVGATLARWPKLGSGYLKRAGCTNTNERVTCPAGVLPANIVHTPARDLSVFCNLGADWFTETRLAVAVSAGAGGSVTISYNAGSGSFSCNDKVYAQGGRALLTEAGEWALDSVRGLLYYWPRNQSQWALGRGRAVASTAMRILDIRGSAFERARTRAHSLSFDGLTLSGSDFGSDGYTLWRRGAVPNSTPKKLREGMVRVENASDITLTRCRLLDAGQSAVWIEGFE